MKFMKPTLLVMAAGIGSRYGGLKQLDSIGPNQETIIDYSIFDAKRAGFGKVVFIIRKNIEEDFKTIIGHKWQDQLPIEYVHQELAILPEGFSLPAGREKPWGTGHAILMARDVIQEPFAAINADDFYGADAFGLLGRYLAQANDGAQADYCMVGYLLRNTLSDHGSVSRGICHTDADDHLTTVIETHGIERWDRGARYPDETGRFLELKGDDTASMNFWGFTPSIFEHLEAQFVAFLHEHGQKPRSEFLIPTVVSHLIQTGEATVRVLRSSASWFGVTYREDRPFVQQQIQSLIKQGIYPHHLWT